MTHLSATQSKLGKRSVILGILVPILLLVFVGLGIFISESLKYNKTGSAILIVAIIATPIAHGVGIVLGIRALNKPADSKKLGVIGILLNVGLIALGIAMFSSVFKYIGAFR